MSITVNGNDLNDIRHQIGEREKDFDISIKWRRSDYGREHLTGCIVDATATGVGNTVPKEFDVVGDAVSYIEGILRKHDEWVKGGCKPVLLAKES